jgi:hypothetical protein
MNARIVLKSIPAALVGATLSASHAFATMPTLMPMPAIKSKPACLKWGREQKDEDATYMWGMLEDGTTSQTVAVRRLANYCMTGKYPLIVTSGESIGEHDQYCKSFPASAACDAPHK